MLVGLDPGHGGTNTGCSVGGAPEKDYTLKFCELLQKEMYDLGVDSVLLRGSDSVLSFTERAKISDRLGCRFVVSIHVNANPDPKVCGFRAYVQSYDVEMHTLARLYNRYIPDYLKLKGLIPRTPVTIEKTGLGPDAVTRRYKCQALLAELAFASNLKDLIFLTNREKQVELAKALAKATEVFLVSKIPVNSRSASVNP